MSNNRTKRTKEVLAQKAGASNSYVEFRLNEWQIERALPVATMRSIRKVMGELAAESLLRLKDPRLEVRVVPEGFWRLGLFHRRSEAVDSQTVESAA